MAAKNTPFDEYLAQEVEKCRGISFPVKASALRRLLVKRVPCARLHPNPEDEFCDPAIGPNNQIISGYMEKFRKARKRLDDFRDSAEVIEPIIVEKVHPEGYMILNGHHRWAAALRSGEKKIRVKIVNLTQEKDVEKVLDASTHDKRVTLDLDEVILKGADDEFTERALPLPWRLAYQERVRLGVPALFHYLTVKGYDIWVYTSRYESMDYIARLFKLYRADVSGVITGAHRKARKEEREKLENRVSNKYRLTIHIDNHALLAVDSRSKAYEDHALSGSPAAWSKEVMNILEGMKQHE